MHTLRDDQVVPVFGHFTVGGRGHWPLAQLGLGRLPCSLPDRPPSPPPSPPPPPPPLFLDPSLCGLAAKKQPVVTIGPCGSKYFPVSSLVGNLLEYFGIQVKYECHWCLAAHLKWGNGF